MNALLAEGHMDYRDAHKPKARGVIELSKKIEGLTRRSQKVYNSYHYIKFCLTLAEEQKYGAIP
jgi:hypothetical protein